MAPLWLKHGPHMVLKNWFLLNPNQCAQGCSMPNFTFLGVSCSAFFLEMAKTLPFYGQNMVLTWSLKLILPESQSLYPGIFKAKFHIAWFIP